MKKYYLKPVLKLMVADADIITLSGKDNEVDFSWSLEELKTFYN